MRNVEILRRELRMWEKELESLQQESYVGGATEGGASGVIGDRTGNRATRVADMKNKVEQAVIEIQDVIAEEEDSLMRQILNYRCIHGYTWKKISRKIYGSVDYSESLRQMYHRHVTNVTKQCDNIVVSK